jgi:hypothetical protein
LVHQLRTECLNAEGICGAGGGREVSVETDGEDGIEEERMMLSQDEDARLEDCCAT